MSDALPPPPARLLCAPRPRPASCRQQHATRVGAQAQPCWPRPRSPGSPAQPAIHELTPLLPLPANRLPPSRAAAAAAAAKPVPMQPWINAHAPRLRMTPDSCPDVTQPTFDNCYTTRAAGKVCASGRKSFRAGEPIGWVRGEAREIKTFGRGRRARAETRSVAPGREEGATPTGADTYRHTHAAAAPCRATDRPLPPACISCRKRTARDHREQAYLSALLACTKPAGFSDKCINALRYD